jgi:glycosyltransferase involved in cell wall biosynthesis
MKPLVSILIPAYNAEEYIVYTLKSVIAQTWPRKEIIVIDDGSTDRTAEIVRRYASKDVRLVSTKNQGLSAAVNHGLRMCQGDYIQELDSDDLLAPDKIERQLLALRESDSKRLLLSSPWAHFYFRTRHSQFIPNALWHDLSPVEWLLRKMGQNLHMQNATWLVSRELVDAAGPWDDDLAHDQDGEYFARVLLASVGTRFVREARIFYRLSGSHSVSHIGRADNKKRDSLLRSMKLHIQYLRSLEESERVRSACLEYLQTKFIYFYPERPDIVAELQNMAMQLGGRLKESRLRSKYAWMKPIFGFAAAKRAQHLLPMWKGSLARRWDKTMFELENRADSGALLAEQYLEPHANGSSKEEDRDDRRAPAE